MFNQNHPTVTIIIPCYNEGTRIIPVLTASIQCNLKPEIIVVDDGSDSGTKDVLSQYPQIKVITHPQNQGKTAAMETGVRNATGDIIVFLDADLVNIQPNHINQLVEPIINQGYDMVLGEREVEVYGFLGKPASTMVTGERATKRDILLKYPDIFRVKQYLIEPAMNKILFHQYKVGQIKLKKVEQCSRQKKVGFIKGSYSYIKYFVRNLLYMGPFEYLYQVNFVSRLPTLN